MYFLLKMGIVYCHVSLPEGNIKLKNTSVFLIGAPRCSRHIVQVGCQVLLQQTVHNSLEHGDEKGIALKKYKERDREQKKRARLVGGFNPFEKY